MLQRQSSGCVYSSTHGFNPEEIREKLQAFPGGSIDLLKQESGVAVLTINNPSRMNAFSGKVSVHFSAALVFLGCNSFTDFYVNKLLCSSVYCFEFFPSQAV